MQTSKAKQRHRQAGARSSQSFSALKQRQLLFLLTRQLAEAQFARGDRILSDRLWQEVAALELDPERIVNLLYGVADHGDIRELETVDQLYLDSLNSPRRGWWATPFRDLTVKAISGWHRSAPPAAFPAHP